MKLSVRPASTISSAVPLEQMTDRPWKNNVDDWHGKYSDFCTSLKSGTEMSVLAIQVLLPMGNICRPTNTILVSYGITVGQAFQHWGLMQVDTHTSLIHNVVWRKLYTSSEQWVTSHSTHNRSFQGRIFAGAINCAGTDNMTTTEQPNKARFPLPKLTAQVNGLSWRVTGFH